MNVKLCEAVSSFGGRRGKQCCLPAEGVLLDGEQRELCHAHRAAVTAGTHEVELVPPRVVLSYRVASDVAAAE